MESDTSPKEWVKEELLQIRKWRPTKLTKVTQLILLFCSPLRVRAAHILRLVSRMSTGICWLRKSMALMSSMAGSRGLARVSSLGLASLVSSFLLGLFHPPTAGFWNVSAEAHQAHLLLSPLNDALGFGPRSSEFACKAHTCFFCGRK